MVKKETMKEGRLHRFRKRFHKTYTVQKTLRHNLMEWGATALSIGGAVLNANQLIQGFYLWTIANILWILFGIKFKHWGLVIMNIVFLCINIFGVFTWWRSPFVILG